MEQHERRLGSIWRSEAVNIYSTLQKMIPYVSLARALIDFLLPLLVGTGAMYLLISGSRSAL